MVVTSRFGERIHPVTGEKKMHSGVDLRAASGTPVLAPVSGRVIETGEKSISGRYLVLQGDDGTRQSFVHLTDAAVPEGATVTVGELIGWTGATGRVTGPHLHWGVSINGAWVDPMTRTPTMTGGGLLVKVAAAAVAAYAIDRAVA